MLHGTLPAWYLMVALSLTEGLCGPHLLEHRETTLDLVMDVVLVVVLVVVVVVVAAVVVMITMTVVSLTSVLSSAVKWCL